MARWPRFLLRVAILLATASCACAIETTKLTLSQYIDQLQQYESQVRGLARNPQGAKNLHASIPPELLVNTSSGRISVSTDFLRDALIRFQETGPKVKQEIISTLVQRLEFLSVEAAEYQKPARAVDDSRAKLGAILSAREFRQAHGPSALELLRDRVFAWLDRLLRKASPHVPDVADLGQIVIWIFIAGSSALLAVWLYRTSRSRIYDKQREIVLFSPSDKSWRVWLAEASGEASSGRWRDAIHLSFWAAVSKLEAEGVWYPDRARTPREYLNAIPASSSAKLSFGVLTRKFEAVWYGAVAASAEDYGQFVAELEKIGCR
jgi:Domain of unknown function (DUF4129)